VTVNLDNDDLNLALMALRHTIWRAKQQLDKNAIAGDAATGAVWYCARHCVGQMENLIARIESRPADHMGKDDGNTAGS
jgi:hypothetical protein